MERVPFALDFEDTHPHVLAEAYLYNAMKLMEKALMWGDPETQQEADEAQAAFYRVLAKLN